jgi:hypothetical protein
MQTNLDNVIYIIGNQQMADKIDAQPAMEPFADKVVTFLNEVSNAILNNKEAGVYPDVITFAFWCRKASVEIMKKEYIRAHGGIGESENNTSINNRPIRYGRGCVFHIAPSNVPVNYAYSLVVGILAGNSNIVRLPSKYFPQVNLINSGIKTAIEKYPQLAPYICMVKYGYEKEVTDYFSLKCDTRVIWGGDNTIAEIRKSPLKPRANEITFADRYSISVINSEKYLEMDGKERIASDFYNDTYLTDQNACTSPRIVIWLGKEETCRKSQETFWSKLVPLIEEKYVLQSVQAVSKLASVYKIGANFDGVRVNEAISYKPSNKLIRVQVQELSQELMEYRNNSGFFMEYYAENLKEIEPLCVDECQTLSYLGVAKEEIKQFLLDSKPRGIDRVVLIGKTMNFDLIWDGYDLIGQLTRIVM